MHEENLGTSSVKVLMSLMVPVKEVKSRIKG